MAKTMLGRDLSPENDDRKFWRGEVVYDAKRTDILDDPLIVVDPDIVRLGTLSGKDHSTVKYNETNKKMNDGQPLPDSTRCVKCSFLGENDGQPVVGNNTYTYPTFRLMRVTGTDKSSIPPFRPTMLAAAELIHHLEDAVEDGGINSTDELQVALMDANIDGQIIAAAAELNKRSGSKW